MFHGPSGFYSDLSVVKKFRVSERLSAQFRMDAFNIFNHPVYAFSQNNGANELYRLPGRKQRQDHSPGGGYNHEATAVCHPLRLLEQKRNCYTGRESQTPSFFVFTCFPVILIVID